MGEVHYYAHVTDEETEAEKMNNAHQITQLRRDKAYIGTLLYCRASVLNYYAILFLPKPYPKNSNCIYRVSNHFTVV